MFEHTENVLERDEVGFSLEVLMILIDGIAMQQSIVDRSLSQYIQGGQITLVPENHPQSTLVVL